MHLYFLNINFHEHFFLPNKIYQIVILTRAKLTQTTSVYYRIQNHANNKHPTATSIVQEPTLRFHVSWLQETTSTTSQLRNKYLQIMQYFVPGRYQTRTLCAPSTPKKYKPNFIHRVSPHQNGRIVLHFNFLHTLTLRTQSQRSKINQLGLTERGLAVFRTEVRPTHFK